MKNNSLVTKLLMLAVTLALAAYFGFQALQYFSDPLSTTLAYAYRVEESADLSGYVVRDERALPAESGGLLRLQREEGERVSAGGTVAAVYADQASLDRQTEMEALTARVEQLRYAQETALGVEVAQKLDAQIRQNILEYRTALTADRLQDAEKQGAELRSQVMKRDFAVSDTEDLEGQLEALQARLKDLRAQTAGSIRRITAPEAGLYSAVSDGYEAILTPEGLEELTPLALAALEADSGARSNVGKLVFGREWYYAAPLPAETAEELAELEKEGLTLRFAKGVERDLPVTISSIGPEENGRVVAVFRGTEYLSQLTLLRQQSAQVIYDAIEGIRVPREALRVVTETETGQDGAERETQTTGVYCVVGMEARFKPVEILYNTENFALVRPEPPAGNEILRLRPGDEVIISAKGLYDGKVIG